MEAEKLWEEWDVRFAQTILGPIDVPVDDTIRTGCVNAREAYKSQLKKLIEGEIAKIRSDKHHSSYDLKAIQTLEKVLLLTEEVKPPQP